jgi:excinuclease UvrABC nuclease subunit
MKTTHPLFLPSPQLILLDGSQKQWERVAMSFTTLTSHTPFLSLTKKINKKSGSPRDPQT